MAVEQYHHLKHNSTKIQVDSAIRDGNGAKIDTTYVKMNNLGNASVGQAKKIEYTGDVSLRDLTLVDANSSDVPGYMYKYSFSATGATVDHTPFVIFTPQEILKGVWAPNAGTDVGVIYLYANVQLDTLAVTCGYVLL